MPWKLAHRPRGASAYAEIESEAETSGEAIEQLRSEIPEDHVIHYVGRVHVDESSPPS